MLFGYFVKSGEVQERQLAETETEAVIMKCLGALIGVLVFVGGCSNQTLRMDYHVKPVSVLEASYTNHPVVLDGGLDDPVWKVATPYPMSISRDKVGCVTEPGELRLAWDDKNLYIGVLFSDSDLVAEGDSDQLMHWQLGDVCELFLKPEAQTWYWELYVTPHGRKSSYLFPGRGRIGLPGGLEYQCGMQVAGKYRGTLNDWTDQDEGWSAELVMPIADLTARGEEFGPDAEWRIMVGRYNYSRYLSRPELTMVPQLSITNFHTLEEYAVLKLVR